MPLVTYENASAVYFNNNFNKMFNITNVQANATADQDTGWHFIPNQLYRNWLTPRQWFDLVTNHDKFKIHSCETTVQNMIPLTDNLAIGQDTTFMTFNNTIYALGYTDKHYETNYAMHPMEPIFKEGVTISATGTIAKQSLPTYTHKLNKPTPTTVNSCFAWDPFIHPSSLMELRPGKNAIKFGWVADPVDNDKWYSTARDIVSVNHDTQVTDRHNVDWIMLNEPITPGQLIMEDPRFDFKHKEVMYYKKQWRYPINNWFIKMIPIVDSKSNLLKHEAHVFMVRKITFEVTPRTNTTNWPQLQHSFADTSKFNWAFGTLPTINYDMALRPAERQGVPPPTRSMDQTDMFPDAATEKSTEDKDYKKIFKKPYPVCKK